MDPVQLVVSFILIVLVALLAAKLFPANEVLTEASVLDDYQRYNPDAVVVNSIVGLDLQTALLQLDSRQQQLGMVTRLGDRLVCRTVLVGDIASFAANGDQLTIHSHDFTLPKITIRLAAEDMTAAQDLVSAFTSENGGTNAA